MFLLKTLLAAAAAAAALFASPPAAAQPRRIPEPPRALISPALHRIAERLVGDGAPGALVIVRTPAGIRRGASGLARLRPRVAMAPDDKFRVGSITKTFVATVVLQLVGEGTLRLDDPIERWLPGLVLNGDAITIRELLDHTSGLFDYLKDSVFVKAVSAHPARSWTPLQLVAVATRHRPLFAPGASWSYSNTNYILLGLVVEAATHTSLSLQLQQRLFQPLDLTQTTLPTRPQIPELHAHGYIGSATLPRLKRLFDATTVESPTVAWAAGGIVSDADNLTTFYRALLGGDLLPPDLLAAMETPAPGTGYGLGLYQVQTTCGLAWGHDGIATGYRTAVYATPDGSHVATVAINIDETYLAQSELEDATETALCSSRTTSSN